MGLFSNIRSLLRAAFSSVYNDSIADLLPENAVVFAGLDEGQRSNMLEFGYYVYCEDEFVWLPSGTYDEKTVKLLENMKVGQAFVIIEEEAFGGIGTIVHNIAVLDIPPFILQETPNAGFATLKIA